MRRYLIGIGQMVLIAGCIAGVLILDTDWQQIALGGLGVVAFVSMPWTRRWGSAPEPHQHIETGRSAIIIGAGGGSEAKATRADQVRERLSDTIDKSVVPDMPAVMPFGKATEVSVTLASEELSQALIAMSESLGVPAPAKVPLTNLVAADLSGNPDFVEIIVEGERAKTVLPETDTVFRWRVRPLRIGQFDLVLRLTNMATIEGESHSVECPAYRYEVRVTATVLKRAKLWADGLGPVQKLTAFIVTLIGIFTAIYGVWSGDEDGAAQPRDPTKAEQAVEDPE